MCWGDADHARDHLLRTYFVPGIGLNLVRESPHLGPGKTLLKFDYPLEDGLEVHGLLLTEPCFAADVYNQ